MKINGKLNLRKAEHWVFPPEDEKPYVATYEGEVLEVLDTAELYGETRLARNGDVVGQFPEKGSIAVSTFFPDTEEDEILFMAWEATRGTPLFQWQHVRMMVNSPNADNMIPEIIRESRRVLVSNASNRAGFAARHAVWFARQSENMAADESYRQRLRSGSE